MTIFDCFTCIYNAEIILSGLLFQGIPEGFFKFSFAALFQLQHCDNPVCFLLCLGEVLLRSSYQLMDHHLNR